MAQDSIMGNLFGVSPAIYEQNKEEATRKQALEFSKLDPYERTNALAFIGGRGLGNIVGGALGAQDPVMMTLSKRAELGQKYDLTKERIRQIKERAIKRLQKARYSNALKAYLG